MDQRIRTKISWILGSGGSGVRVPCLGDYEVVLGAEDKILRPVHQVRDLVHTALSPSKHSAR
jgi:hypothetical protein